ncbi:DUF3459 domain-containing protein [Bosea sp. RCC_152_1]|uniref:DUF3459 domain-containing protein n=1 Tax=Bosea sp. RCC_152_1 TaxID=3239228 RepID=UPI00352545FC
MQSHDQIGNRLTGDRVTALADEAAIKAWASIYLLSPQIPMLFMVEEWSAGTPFPFFSDMPPERRDETAKGQHKELRLSPEAGDPDKPEVTAALDPTDPATFARAKIDWTELDKPRHQAWLAWYRQLIALRRAEIIPLLPRIGGFSASYEMAGERAATVRWSLDDGSRLVLQANLSPDANPDLSICGGRRIWQHGLVETERLGPWPVALSFELPGGADNLG